MGEVIGCVVLIKINRQILGTNTCYSRQLIAGFVNAKIRSIPISTSVKFHDILRLEGDDLVVVVLQPLLFLLFRILHKTLVVSRRQCTSFVSNNPTKVVVCEWW